MNDSPRELTNTYEERVNKAFSDHYKKIGEIKKKIERKQERRIKLIFVCIVIFIIAGVFNGY